MLGGSPSSDLRLLRDRLNLDYHHSEVLGGSPSSELKLLCDRRASFDLLDNDRGSKIGSTIIIIFVIIIAPTNVRSRREIASLWTDPNYTTCLD